VTRRAISNYKSDTGEYPEQLETLVEKKYLEKIPSDPWNDSPATWEIIWLDQGNGRRAVADIRSSSKTISSNGTPYANW
jgi:general secretion pathway protein G